MMVSASSERMPVRAGSAGLRVDVAMGLPAFLGVGCSSTAGSLVKLVAFSSNTCIKLYSNPSRRTLLAAFESRHRALLYLHEPAQCFRTGFATGGTTAGLHAKIRVLRASR